MIDRNQNLEPDASVTCRVETLQSTRLSFYTNIYVMFLFIIILWHKSPFD